MAVEYLNIILDGDKFVGLADDLGRAIRLGRWENGCLRIGADELADLDIMKGEVEEMMDAACYECESYKLIDELKDQLNKCQDEKERLETQIDCCLL